MKRISKCMLASVIFACLTLIGCSSGSSTSTDIVAPTVSGVAAAGAPLSGTVSLKDSSNPVKELSQNIATDGSFSFDVSNLTAPFILKAVGTAGGKNFTLFSFKSTSGIANINPLSNLAVGQANGGADLSSLYDAPAPAQMQAISADLPTAITGIQAKLDPLLSLCGASFADFISGTFTANHQGLDLVFDLASVSIGAGTVTITNKASGAIIFTSTLGGSTLSGEINMANLPALPTDATYAISGKVTTAAGVGIPGVTVTPSGSAAPVTTDAGGNYNFDGVQNGSYTLSASLSGSTFNPPSVTAVVNNANATGQNFISLIETAAALPGDKFFAFAGGVFDGGAPSEIMYNDLDGALVLPHASILKVNQAYADIIQAPYGIYRDSNGQEPPIFPATAGTVYVVRSIMGATVQYYKLRIVSATTRTDPQSITFGTVNFSYAPILPLDVVDAVGEWQFPDGQHLSVLFNTVMLDYTEAPATALFYTIDGDYTDRATLVGNFTIFNPGPTTGAVTVTLALTADGKLNATLTGAAPLGTVALTGGVKQ